MNPVLLGVVGVILPLFLFALSRLQRLRHLSWVAMADCHPLWGALRSSLPRGPQHKETISVFLHQMAARSRDSFPAFQIWLPGPFIPFSSVHVVITDPELSSELLSSKHADSLEKGMAYNSSRPLIGEGILSSEGELWRAHRRLVEPFFRHSILRENALPTIHRLVDLLIERWTITARRDRGERNGRAVYYVKDLHQDMLRFTADTIGWLALGYDFGGLNPDSKAVLFHAFDVILSTLHARVVLPHFTTYLPTRFNRTFDREMAKLDGIVNDIIDSKWDRQEDLGDQNLLSSLLRRDERGEHTMTKQHVADQVKTLIFAGHDTTAAALSLMFYLLAKHPEVQERLFQEIQEESHAFPSGNPSYEQLEGMKYLGMVIKELLRLYPSAGFSRRPTRDLEIGGYLFPKGCDFYFIPFLQHTDPRFWGEDAKDFKPERWEGGDPLIQGQLNKVYFPFSAGPRNCVGAKLANLELRAATVAVLRRFSLSLPKDLPPPGIALEITFFPVGIDCIFTEREVVV